MAGKNKKIEGNTDSVKTHILRELESVFEIPGGENTFFPREIVLLIASVTARTGREIAVYLDRKGTVLDVSMGGAENVALPEIKGRAGRREERRLSGVRCVHTHPGGDAVPSEPDISAALSNRLDAMVTVGVSNRGEVTGVYVVIPELNRNGEFAKTRLHGPFDLDSPELPAFAGEILNIEKTALRATATKSTGNEKERAILVGVEIGNSAVWIDELQDLAETAGASVVGKMIQKKNSRDTAFLIGRGKTSELALMCQNLEANLVIFDEELSGAQIRNLEEITGVKVIDRTMLILDIFAGRAHTNDGKIQVEIAQLKYSLTRLIGQGQQLSRLGGGIGTRGPGESKLETDRRHIRRRIKNLEDELLKLARTRDNQRKSRKRNSIPVAAIVGYTNTGKSTLLNKLCGASVFTENSLFATLDPSTRSLTLPNGSKILLTDTVGFIRKLPHELIEAFKSTLDEAVYADILVHVADLSSPDLADQIEVVDGLLKSLGATGKPVILALNKADLVTGSDRPALHYNGDPLVLEISAKTGKGLDNLKKSLQDILQSAQIS